MTRTFDAADVPTVTPEALLVPMRAAIAKGQGLALLNGLEDHDIRALEDIVWQHFANDKQTRLAVALRFRALLDVFRARRLKHLFLTNGFKLIARAVAEAATQRLNAEFGFKTQRFVEALSTAPAARRPANVIELRPAA